MSLSIAKRRRYLKFCRDTLMKIMEELGELRYDRWAEEMDWEVQHLNRQLFQLPVKRKKIKEEK